MNERSSWCLNRLNVWKRRLDTAVQFLNRRGFLHLLMLVMITAVMRGRSWVLPDYSLSLDLDDYMTPSAPQTASVVTRSTRGGSRQLVEPVSSVSSPPVPRIVTWDRLPTIFWSPVPHTIVPARLRREVITYTVNSGDNLYTIAEKFGLKPNTLIWANPELEEAPDLLYIGQQILILPLDGVYHTVAQGETLEKIAETYRVSVKEIVGCPYNGFEFEPYRIVPGQKLIIPGRIKPFKPRVIRSVEGQPPNTAARGSGNFVWPVGGYISQGFWELHQAIDIAGAHGDIVVAADAGYVIYASWDTHGYGNLVVIDHGNGFVTYYAHLYGFTVDVGQSVVRGQQIGARGSTGRSTGPHLHFEIRYNGEPRNPISFLPGQ